MENYKIIFYLKRQLNYQITLNNLQTKFTNLQKFSYKFMKILNNTWK